MFASFKGATLPYANFGPEVRFLNVPRGRFIPGIPRIFRRFWPVRRISGDSQVANGSHLDFAIYKNSRPADESPR
jgi:hypothetical protein